MQAGHQDTSEAQPAPIKCPLFSQRYADSDDDEDDDDDDNDGDTVRLHDESSSMLNGDNGLKLRKCGFCGVTVSENSDIYHIYIMCCMLQI